ncbi:MAG: ureidoglycolate lyase [Acidiferrobacterales bacterium]|nr:ureidoglycolate lyase [Acidiferrobacterales bacterium]
MTSSTTIELQPVPLSSEAFAPFGDVISGQSDNSDQMNGSAYNRFLDLAEIDIGDADINRVQVNIVECNQPETFPYLLHSMERHPESSQMFFPLFDHDYLVAVAPSGLEIDRAAIRLFIASCNQGINYHRGTWHMPMLGIAKGDRFLMVERNAMHLNCDVLKFKTYHLKLSLPSSIDVAIT